MSADEAKYLLSVSDVGSQNFEVTSFAGVDAISSPYCFDIEFRMSGAAKAANIAPLDATVLDKACRLDIVRNGETISYCGIVSEFRACNSDDTRYTVRLVPRIYRLMLNFTYRIFQKLTIPDIIKKVVEVAELDEYFRFELEPDTIKYPEREFCVQYRETDLAFISRLMEESGIWYYFEQVEQPDGALKECAVVTDVFSSYPLLDRSIPFMNGSGLAEVTKNGNVVESINYISASVALMPQNVRVRAYNHRVPEAPPDGMSDVTDGHSGQVYEYGGSIWNSSEAEYRATLCARRLWVERLRIDGRGNCASFRAGMRVSIDHSRNLSMSGEYLLTVVRHSGGWVGGAYTYNNEFSSVRAEPEIYAPPLRTPVPRIDGVTTAPVGATGDSIPTLDEYGHYNVNMPYVLKDEQESSGKGGGDYGGSKLIRVAQPSGGMSDGTRYGMHFPSKRGAEMVMAYIDGNPDKPVGLGFVPNAAALSVSRNVNCVENILRTWGGNELLMDDTKDDKYIKMTTPDARYIELHDGDKLVRVKSEHCEMLFNDIDEFAHIETGGHKIHINYKKDKGRITITTLKGNVIQMDDPDDIIALQNASEDGGNKVNKVVLDGKKQVITLDSKDNTVVLNGKETRITLESKDSKVAVDGNGKKIAMENKNNKVVIDGGGNTIILNAKKDINIKAGGKIILDAKGGISDKGPTYDVN